MSDTLTYLFAAYNLIWLLLFGYLWTMGRAQKRLERELRDLAERLRSRV